MRLQAKPEQWRRVGKRGRVDGRKVGEKWESKADMG